MGKVGLAIAGTLATGVISAGAFIGYQQLSNNSKPNSNVSVQQANSNPANSNVNKAQAFKNNLIGTWRSVLDPDNPNNKVVFTTDGVLKFKDEKLKYKVLSEQVIEVTDNKDQKLDINVTIEGDVLTITANGNERKYKREPANTADNNANTNSQANNTAANTATATKEEVPLTEKAMVFKNNLVGEWVDDVKTKHKFTENEYELNIGTSRYYKGSYKVVNENTLELVSSDGYKDNVTMRIEGDGNTLIWKQGDEEWTFKRVNPK